MMPPHLYFVMPLMNGKNSMKVWNEELDTFDPVSVDDDDSLAWIVHMPAVSYRTR